MFLMNKKKIKPVKDFALRTANCGPLPFCHTELFEKISKNPDQEGSKMLDKFTDEQLDEYSGSICDDFIDSLADVDKSFIDEQHSRNLAVIEHNKNILQGEMSILNGKMVILRDMKDALVNKSEKRH